MGTPVSSSSQVTSTSSCSTFFLQHSPHWPMLRIYLTKYPQLSSVMFTKLVELTKALHSAVACSSLIPRTSWLCPWLLSSSSTAPGQLRSAPLVHPVVRTDSQDSVTQS